MGDKRHGSWQDHDKPSYPELGGGILRTEKLKDVERSKGSEAVGELLCEYYANSGRVELMLSEMNAEGLREVRQACSNALELYSRGLQKYFELLKGEEKLLTLPYFLQGQGWREAKDAENSAQAIADLRDRMFLVAQIDRMAYRYTQENNKSGKGKRTIDALVDPISSKRESVSDEKIREILKQAYVLTSWRSLRADDVPTEEKRQRWWYTENFPIDESLVTVHIPEAEQKIVQWYFDKYIHYSSYSYRSVLQETEDYVVKNRAQSQAHNPKQLSGELSASYNTPPPDLELTDDECREIGLSNDHNLDGIADLLDGVLPSKFYGDKIREARRKLDESATDEVLAQAIAEQNVLPLSAKIID